MFDQTKREIERMRERVAKFEETHDKARKAHEHFTKHQTKYLVATASGITFAMTRKFGMPSLPSDTTSVSGVIEAAQNAANTFGDVSDTATVIVDQSLNIIQQFSGHACKIVRDAADSSK